MKPIIFNTEMVRAILDGRKTQTRRVIKNLPECVLLDMKRELSKQDPQMGKWIFENVGCPYQPGDILWVRETWFQPYLHEYGRFWYRADGEKIDLSLITGETQPYGKANGLKWRPSIHMPKEAARLFLRVKSARVERLQEITEEDARAEGFSATGGFKTALGAFRELFDEYLAKADGSDWYTNRWVWVIEFEGVDKP